MDYQLFLRQFDYEYQNVWRCRADYTRTFVYDGIKRLLSCAIQLYDGSNPNYLRLLCSIFYREFMFELSDIAFPYCFKENDTYIYVIQREMFQDIYGNYSFPFVGGRIVATIYFDVLWPATYGSYQYATWFRHHSRQLCLHESCTWCLHVASNKDISFEKSRYYLEVNQFGSVSIGKIRLHFDMPCIQIKIDKSF